jgi:hypothetical protein
MTVTKILAAPLLLLLATGCEKNDPTPQYILPSTELRTVLNTKEGSYFVYKNTANGTTDSFWVSNYTDRFSTISGVSYEEISTNMHDISNNTLNFSYSRQYRYKERETMVAFVNTVENFVPVLIMPFTENYESLTTDADSSKLGLQMRQLYSSLTVNGHSYVNVYEVYTFKTKLVNNVQDTVSLLHTFIAQDAGLIKFTFRRQGDNSIIANDTWELERSMMVR